MSKFRVKISKKAERDLRKIPLYIANKFHLWIDLVENEGIYESRKIKSFHDEPLLGNRKGQRSIRLSKSYRAIYVENYTGILELIEVLEVNKHDY